MQHIQNSSLTVSSRTEELFSLFWFQTWEYLVNAFLSKTLTPMFHVSKESKLKEKKTEETFVNALGC